jgi:N-acylglucosamine 2-epimerase
MVLLSTAQILRRCNTVKAPYYARIAKEISDAMILLHYKPDLHCVLENVSADGSFIDNPSGRTVNPGHSCENAWFLMNEALYRKDDGLLKKALNILDWSLELGWDKQFGGIYYFTDINGRPSEQLEWDMKLWWVHNEAMIATLYAYAITKQDKYAGWFEKITDYSFTHFSDMEYGEWYGYLHRDGTVSHTQKGSIWKGPFHLPRCLMICDSILDTIINGKPAVPVL